jgi:hypothetical protein
VKNDANGPAEPQSKYPSRQPAVLIDAHVSALLVKLRELEHRSNPLAGQSAEDKDIYAHQALTLAGLIVMATAGWAIDHQYGLALEGLMFVPLAPPELAKSAKYRAEKKRVDDHTHESRGAKARRSVVDPAVARRALINVLLPNSNGLSEVVREMALEALFSLEYGEVLPILAPTKGNKKLKYRELQLQLKAVAFVAYRDGLGMDKGVAQEFVAGAYGQSKSTLHTWEQRLPEQIGEIEVVHAISIAESAALKVRAGQEIFGAMYNNEVVRRFGDIYKQVQRSKKQVKRTSR